jgi:hypothetical protein
LRYDVVVEHDDEYVTLLSDHSIDYLVSKFRTECINRVKGKYTDLLAPLQYHILDENNDHHGLMVWAKAKENKHPLLVVSLENRNISMIYDVKGKLVNKRTLT